MPIKYQSSELLSPGGSIESIKSAVNAGSDAIYVGGKYFSARANAENLDDFELFNIIEFLHIRNKKLYLAVNTLIKNSELKALYDYVVRMYEGGVDAFIVQDLCLIDFIGKYLPEVEIHASTQMAIGGSNATNYLKQSNVKRIIMPRELNLSQIQSISQNTKMDLECFAHGALCYSYSGNCLMSSMICGRSGNRGRCAQSCRLPYIYEKGEKNSYPLSLKELSNITFLPEMIKSGITSLKLEGRMRSASYVRAITGIYRKYLDMAIMHIKKGTTYSVDKEDLKLMKQIFNRDGFTSYLSKQSSNKMISFFNSSAKYDENTAIFTFEKNKTKNKSKLNISAKMILSCYKNAYLEFTCICNDKKIVIKEISENIIEPAQNCALTYEKIFKQLKKSDDEYLNLLNLDLEMKDAIFMPISELNDLRRRAYSSLKKEIKKAYLLDNKRILSDEVLNLNKFNLTSNIKYINRKKTEISVYLSDYKNIDIILKHNFVDNIYLELSEILINNGQNRGDFILEINNILNLANKDKNNGKYKIFLALPHILEEIDNKIIENTILQLEDTDISGYLIRNIEELAILDKIKTKKIIISDYLIYAMNIQSMNWIYEHNVNKITVPVELNYKEIKAFKKQSNLINFTEILIYGHPIAMVSHQCIKKNHNKCDNKYTFTYLFDRKKYKFPIKSFCHNLHACYNIIYNSKKIFLADLYNKLKDLSVGGYRLDFTCENRKEIDSILDMTYAFLCGDFSKDLNFDYSRGHFNRGVE